MRYNNTQTVFNFRGNAWESHYPLSVIHFRPFRPQVMFPKLAPNFCHNRHQPQQHLRRLGDTTTSREIEGKVDRWRGNHGTSLKWNAWLSSLSSLWATHTPFLYHCYLSFCSFFWCFLIHPRSFFSLNLFFLLLYWLQFTWICCPSFFALAMASPPWGFLGCFFFFSIVPHLIFAEGSIL